MDTLADQRLLEQRYGTHRPVRRATVLVVTVLVAGAGLGWLLWAAWVNSDPPIRAEIAAFDVTGPHDVRTTVQVRVRDRYVRGSCLLRATAVDHSIVGETTMAVDGKQPNERVVQVRTEREATTVEVVRCTAN